jgi:uncharacterized membrane protein YdcZ (DUF606 family)
MSFLFYLLPLFLGLTVVTQGTLNRRVSADWGLASTVFLNATVFFGVSLLLIIAVQVSPKFFPEYLKVQSFDLSKFKSWFLIPGLCGFFLVLGVPWSLQVNGPSKTFILLIVAQIILSLVVEKFFFAGNPSSMKILGALIAAIGAVIVSLN